MYLAEQIGGFFGVLRIHCSREERVEAAVSLSLPRLLILVLQRDRRKNKAEQMN